VREAVTQALSGVEALADLHASAEYRKRVAVDLAAHAVTDARDEALGKSNAH
jgi:CO/xanthine dehydrogenase FAD-binding subunit